MILRNIQEWCTLQKADKLASGSAPASLLANAAGEAAIDKKRSVAGWSVQPTTDYDLAAREFARAAIRLNPARLRAWPHRQLERDRSYTKRTHSIGR
jgi:hypothetical protein